MNTFTRMRRGDDKGMTLIEVLVSIVLLAIVGTIVTGIVVAMMRLTSSTSSGVAGEGELNDAVSRIARDIAASDPILYTHSEAGWSNATPNATDLWIQGVANNKCTRTRYFLDTATTPDTLKSTTQTYGAANCPDPRLPDTATSSVTKVLIKDFKATNDAGSTLPLFTYYDQKNNLIAVPVSRPNVAKIARVKIDVGSNVRGRAKGVRLATSVAPRSANNTLITGVPPAICISLAGTNGANLAAVTDSGYPPAPRVSWTATDYVDRYTLTRRYQDPVTMVTTDTVLGTWTGANTVTDTAMRGRHSTSIIYFLEMEGPGGIVTCDDNVTIPAGNIPSPDLTVVLRDDTSSTFLASTTVNSVTNLSWPAWVNPSNTATPVRYDIYRRPIDANVGYANTGAYGARHGTTSTVSFSTTQPFDTGFEYMLKAVETAWYPVIVSPDSNTGKVVSHPAPASVSANTPTLYRSNTVAYATVSATPTVDGFSMWSKANGTAAWAQSSGSPFAVPAGTTSGTRNFAAALDSRTDYRASAYNVGPRGTDALATTTLRYNGANTGGDRLNVLQFPKNPSTTAIGTTNGANPDGTNSVTWTYAGVPGLPPTATDYDVWEFDNVNAVTGAASNGINIATATPATHKFTGRPRGSRDGYIVAAHNATGWSENKIGANRANPAIAYQRPPTPTSWKGTLPNLNSNYGTFGFSGTGDAGEPNDRFCGRAASGTANTGSCAYEIHGYNNSAADGYGNDRNWTYGGGYDSMGIGIDASNWGVRDYFYFNACNAGGCSDWTWNNLDAYPGPFDVNWVKQATEGDFAHSQENAATTLNGERASGYPVWTQSINGGTYALNAHTYANDSWNIGEDLWRDDSIRSGTSKFYAPGGSYYANVTAHAANGLTRLVQGTISFAPAPLSRMQTTKACSNGATDPGGTGARGGWKPGKRHTASSVFSIDFNGNGVRGPYYDEWNWAYYDHTRFTEAVGRPGGGEAEWANGQNWIDWIRFTHDYWAAGGGFRRWEDGGWWVAQQDWDFAYYNWGSRVFYSHVYGTAPRKGFDSNWSSSPLVAGSWANDNLYVYDGKGFGGAIMAQNLAAAANPAAQQGDYAGKTSILIEHINATIPNIECPDDGNSGWKDIPGFVSQRAHYPWVRNQNPNSPNSWRNEV